MVPFLLLATKDWHLMYMGLMLQEACLDHSIACLYGPI